MPWVATTRTQDGDHRELVQTVEEEEAIGGEEEVVEEVVLVVGILDLTPMITTRLLPTQEINHIHPRHHHLGNRDFGLVPPLGALEAT